MVQIFSASVSQSSCLKADSSFIWKTTAHNRFLVLFTSEFYRVLKRNSSELIAMKHKLNYTVEVSSKLTTLFIFSFSESESESWFDGRTFRSRTFHAMYLAAKSFVFA